MIFNFLFCENAYDNENSFVKIQNLIVNHESRPLSYPGKHKTHVTVDVNLMVENIN